MPYFPLWLAYKVERLQIFYFSYVIFFQTSIFQIFIDFQIIIDFGFHPLNSFPLPVQRVSYWNFQTVSNTLCSIYFLLLCNKVSHWKAAIMCIRIWIYSVEYVRPRFLSANHNGKQQLQAHLLHFLFRVYILLYLCLKIFCIYTLKSLRRY